MSVLARRLKDTLPWGSQKRIAELAGLTAETVTRWKKGQGNPRLSELEAFAAALEVSLCWLVDDGAPAEKPALPPTSAEERRIERYLREGERILAGRRDRRR